jgi:ankyrin repeat protein
LQAVSIRTPFFTFCRALLLKPFVIGVIQPFGNTVVLETTALPPPMDRYRYSSLDLEERSFRLLRLFKGDKGPIRCEIFDAQLDDIISYDALSYTWGDQSNLREIEIYRITSYVHKMVLPVTKNLYAALQRIRSKGEDRVLWIDAICIDQSDTKERGHQVKQMSSIYEKATKVIFWLGESTLEAQMAFDYMGELQKEALVHARKSWTISDKRWQPLRLKIKPPLNNTHESWNIFLRDGFRDLFGRTWFRRAWIVQEVAQARTAEVMCGAQSIPVRIFAVTASSLEMETEHHCQAILDIMPGPSQETSWWAEQRDLRTLLYKFRKSERMDPRDAIYSLLGISSDKEVANFPTPDYHISEKALIPKTVAYFVRLNGIKIDENDLPWWKMDHFLDDLPWLESEIFKWMTFRGRIDVPNMLLDTDQVGINLEDRYGLTLLEWAKREKQEKTVKLLRGSDMDRLEVEFETTHNATALLQLDTDEIRVESAYKDGLAPQSLLRAAQTGYEAMFRRLLNTDNIDVKINCPDPNGLTPLAWAARNGHDQIVQLILDIDKVNVNLEDRNGSTPLLWAARNGHDTTTRLLLHTNKFNVNSCNRARSTPLLWAARNGHHTTVELLLNETQAKVGSEDQNRLTPLLWAARNGHNTVIELLLNKNPFLVQLQDQNGLTPLLWAARNGHNTTIELLLHSILVSTHERDQNELTAMHWAARNGHKTVVELLQLRSGRDVLFLEDQDGFTPLLWAVRNGHHAVVELLLCPNRTALPSHQTYRTEMLLKTQKGLTAMHWAAKNGHNTTISLLMHVGATDIYLENQDGLSLLSWARKEGYNEAANLLLEEHELRSMYQIDTGLFSPEHD